MATDAHVTSVEALGTFRVDLILFRDAAIRVLDEVTGEVNRTRQWVRTEQRMHWEGEVRKRQKRLDAAQQDLLSARMSSLRDDTLQQAALRKARAAFHEAEDKLRAVKHWERNYDLAVDPLVKQMGGLRTVLEHSLPRAIAFLSNAQQALEVYSEKMGAPSDSPPEATAEEPGKI